MGENYVKYCHALPNQNQARRSKQDVPTVHSRSPKTIKKREVAKKIDPEVSQSS